MKRILLFTLIGLLLVLGASVYGYMVGEHSWWPHAKIKDFEAWYNKPLVKRYIFTRHGAFEDEFDENDEANNGPLTREDLIRMGEEDPDPNPRWILEPEKGRLKGEDYTKMKPERLISIRSPEDIEKQRKLAIQIIFGLDSLPGTLPETKDTSDRRFLGIPCLVRTRKATVKMEYGIESRGYIFEPDSMNGKFVLYHQGHYGDFYRGLKAIRAFLEAGYVVGALSMPLLGPNNKPQVYLPNLGNFRLEDHNDMRYLPNAIGFFIEPTIAMLNLVEKEYDFDTVSMCGVSGGAWTTTIAAGIDPRINYSFPVAGAAPFYIRFYFRNSHYHGDFEVMNEALYTKVNYLDFYVMAAAGENRKQVQIFNIYDSCCYDGKKFMHYKDVVQSVVQRYGPGDFRAYGDDTHHGHKFSKFAVELVKHEMAGGKGPK